MDTIDLSKQLNNKNEVLPYFIQKDRNEWLPDL